MRLPKKEIEVRSSDVSENYIGAFFTPLEWTKWVVKRYGLFERWMGGASILDPTAGNGNFLEAFIAIAAEKEIPLRREMLKRLFGVEREDRYVGDFFLRIKQRYNFDFPEENYRCEDFILSKYDGRADVVVGNPPWQNFADLPTSYKAKIRASFVQYHLAPRMQDLLLGGSRIDIAALVTAKSLVDHLKENGSAYFFLPLSILLNDGAHRAFRSYKLGAVDFAVKEIHDFKTKAIFDGVSARYGLVEFKRDEKQCFPIPYHVSNGSSWIRNLAGPLFNADDPLSIVGEADREFRDFADFQRIEVPVSSKPRQGINTCGANDVFVFDSAEMLDGDTAIVSNSAIGKMPLPVKYLYPLAAKENFNQPRPVPRRFVLLPYNSQSGRPLELSELLAESSLYAYLRERKLTLQGRRGVLINGWIKRGYWWALLGVGAYSFSPYKIMWEAFGRDYFMPRIFSSVGEMCWQGNQALHAYIPMSNSVDAERICEKLRHPIVNKFLLSNSMEGTCNWAQPGKISRLLSVGTKVSLELQRRNNSFI